MTPVDPIIITAIVDQIDEFGKTTTIIHFACQVGGEWCVACMPNMKEFHQTRHHPVQLRTNEPRGVTCPECKKTAAYVRMMRAYR